MPRAAGSGAFPATTPSGNSDSAGAVYFRMTPTAFGGLLGLCNTVLIAIGLSVIEPHDRIGAAIAIACIGSIPAGLTGIVLGSIAGTTAQLAVWQRRLILIPPAIGAVALLSIVCMMTSYFAVACIPTLAAALLLETRTRSTFRSPVPLATAR
jgi:hypothetical protein